MQASRRSVCVASLTLPVAIGARRAWAQDVYPVRPVKVVVPFAPGGGTDFTARMIAMRLGEKLGQPVLVENKPGAGSVLGTTAAVKAPADGYTLLVISGSYVVNPSIYKLGFDPIRDIAPVIQLTRGGYVLVVHPDVPARTLGELITLMRRRPGELTYASSGQGGHLQVVTEYMLRMAGVSARHVPYRGTGPALADLAAGTVQMMFGGTEVLMPHVAAGRLRALAVTTARRLERFPDLPSVAEAGLAGYDVVAWHGMVAPANTPRPVIDTLNRHLNELVREEAMNDKMGRHGVNSAGGTPEQFGAVLRQEIDRYAEVIRDAGIKAGD